MRTVALIGRDAHQHLDDTLRSAAGYDVVFVELPAHAYSRIKRVRPDLIILCLSNDDSEGCQVLSMLSLDRETAHIPLLTCFTPGAHKGSADDTDADPEFNDPGPMTEH
jgi:CheY-like chemotaxis protein